MPDSITDGLEFASPIFDFCRDGTWREEVKNHWVTLLLHGKIAIDNMCATHVHVSPKAEVRWSLKQLKQVAKAVLYFEKAFQAIWAPSRREHKFTRKNKAQNYKLEKLEFGECCKLIEACDDIDHLVALMQPPASSQYNDTLQSDRDYMWNFENTKEDKITGIIGASYGSDSQQMQC